MRYVELLPGAKRSHPYNGTHDVAYTPCGKAFNATNTTRFGSWQGDNITGTARLSLCKHPACQKLLDSGEINED